jgi:hypothetical protein
MVLLILFIIPLTARQTAIAVLVSAFEPFRVLTAFVDWGWLSPLATGAVRVVLINLLVFALLLFVVWSGFKG